MNVSHFSTGRASIIGKITLWAGFAFLYVPIFILMAYSFNESRLVTVWAGFSPKWYGELFRDAQIMAAVWMSLKLAVLTACVSVVLGVMAGVILVRFKRFKGKTLFAALITAPLVMPEVITGLSLLLLFVTLERMVGWPASRGMLTIWLAHVTFCTAYVAVVISSRLSDLDDSLEDAAMDLGATRLKTFFVITLPIISPALFAGWLLAFTLSLDDLVIASFVSGPSSTTLPMEVFSSVRLGISPKINALATIMVGLVGVGVFVAWMVMNREEKRRWNSTQAASSVS